MTAPAAEGTPGDLALDPTSIADEVAEVLLRPARFFRALPRRRLGRLWILLAVVSGCATVADRIDQRLVIASLFPERSAAGTDAVMGDWKVYWGAVASGGLVAAAFLYFIAGWWLGIRTRWSGAAHVDWRLARRIEVFAAAVWALPRLVWGGVETLWFPNYRAAFESSEFPELFVFTTVVWSVFVSYRGITATHTVRRGRAIFWLLLGPLGINALAVGAAVGWTLWSQYGAA